MATDEDPSPPAALRLIHHHPGRLRVRAHALEGPAPSISGSRLEALGVDGVEHQARTGSVLVTYTPGGVEPDEIIDAIADAANLERPQPQPRDPARPALFAIEATRELNRAVEELTGRRTDLRSLVPAAMLGAAAYSWMKRPGPKLPSWENLAYWSYQVFVALHRDEIERTARDTSDPEAG
jgi:hypothetical protein